VKGGRKNILPVPEDVRENKNKSETKKIVKIRRIKCRKVMAVLRNIYK
jgi:hypothetical protein